MSCLLFPPFMHVKTDWALPLLYQHLIMVYVLYSRPPLVLSALCIAEHDGFTVQSSPSSPFTLTVTGLPCPLAADLFTSSVLSLSPPLFSRHASNALSQFFFWVLASLISLPPSEICRAFLVLCRVAHQTHSAVTIRT